MQRSVPCYAVESPYISALKNYYKAYNAVPALQITQHLFDKFGDISNDAIKEHNNSKWLLTWMNPLKIYGYISNNAYSLKHKAMLHKHLSKSYATSNASLNKKA